jgi:CRISPR/Cas system Type II protein with McrA/HNH and RuvC-like nuclease domain
MNTNKNTNRGANGGSGSKWIRPERRLAIYIRDGFCCAYCGRDLRAARAAEVTLDHLTPRSQGGHNKETNLVLACLSCNSSRGDKPWMQYATGGAIERIRSCRMRKINVELAKAIIAGDASNPRAEAAR